MKKQTFFEYLAEQHAKQYNGLDDDMADNFGTWAMDLDRQEIIDFAEAWGKTLITK